MSNLAHIAKIADEYLFDVMECNFSTELVLPHVKRLLANGWQSESAGKCFFASNSSIELRASNGIVETPQSMAAYMVGFAYSRWKCGGSDEQRDSDAIHWFDPCCGAGVFPVEILKFYLDKLGIKNLLSLPIITVSEISELGLAATFINIIHTLHSFGVSAPDYIRAGKLKLILGDTLDRFHQKDDLFSEGGKFDIVIGNPPYVRASRINATYKKKLKQKFPEIYCGSADLYTYFIASGISNIAAFGILVYISPAAFIRAKSGTALRDWLLKNANLDSFIDLDETKVFDDANLHAAVYVFKNYSSTQTDIKYRHIRDQEELKCLVGKNNMLSTASVDATVGAGWAFHSSQSSLNEYSKVFAECVKMKDLGIKVYSGIRPGYSAAFIIDEKQYQKFDAEVRERWIRPLILPANIKKWAGYKKMSYMIVIPTGVASVDNEIISFLEPHKNSLVKRAEIKNKEQWYTLRSCSYYAQMEKKKIAFPDLSAYQRFSLVGQGIYVPDGAYFIDTENLVLLGVLNSDLAKQFFVNRCSSVGNLKSKGRFRFKKEFVKEFPLPRHCLLDGKLQRQIASLVSIMINDGETEERNKNLDELVNAMYWEKQ